MSSVEDVARLVREGEWRKALEVERRSMERVRSGFLPLVLQNAELDAEELLAEDSGASRYLLGEMALAGLVDEELAPEHLEKSAAKGFAFPREGPLDKRWAVAVIAALTEAQRYEDAVFFERRLADELHMRSDKADSNIRRVRIDVRALQEEASASSLFHLAQALRARHPDLQGDAGDKAKAYELYTRAAEKGHVLAVYWMAVLLYVGSYGVAQNRQEGGRLYVEAADRGCDVALFCAARSCREGLGVPQDYTRAALFLLRQGNLRSLRQMLAERPRDVCPFGRWDSACMPLQELVIPEVRAAQLTWMAVAKRRRVPKGVALIVAEYICSLPYDTNDAKVDELTSGREK